ncbi:MAG: excinuclease ABC subunit C [Acidobacteria bacterium]|nr:excinuclease ABC subunit C [Acidobacteriota bacterium]|tara:strand:+ start:4083 stop:6005 length:1923 start_codon:yes stop_codon:yes gene_type:complete
MPIHDLKAQIKQLPEQPGVYLYYDDSGATIYIGRARSLRDRVRSYLGARGTSPKTDALLDKVSRLEVIVTDSLVEALALESHLIKQRGPRFNILLRDDKNYPYLQLTTGESFPRVVVVRRVERDGHTYAGPFLPAALARKTMTLTHKLFGIRSCNEAINGRRGRACLEYDIKRCVAPCVDELCTQEQYAETVEHARLFLEGRNDELLGQLKRRMLAESEDLRYEAAAQTHDAVKTIETLLNRQQKMSTVRLGDRDAFGMKIGSAGGIIQVFQVRGGRVIERSELVADLPAGNELAVSETLEAAVQQFYQTRVPPPEVHVPVEVRDPGPLEAWLTQSAGRKVRLVVPKRGDKRRLLDLATRNAELAYRSRFSDEARAATVALEELRVVLGLSVLPRRIECFDISTLQGAETVGAMVVSEDGQLRPKEYRKYRLRGVGWGGVKRSPLGTLNRREKEANDKVEPVNLDGGKISGRLLDDYAAMREVVGRRYRRLMEEGGPLPELVVIDGGSGQLSSAYESFESLGLSNLVAIGLAKKEELVYSRDSSDPLILEVGSAALRLLQRLRDEAHRVALSYHRRSRRRRDFRSELQDIPGVGAVRRRALLTQLGSVANIRRASREELVPVVGAKAADAVLNHFATGRR